MKEIIREGLNKSQHFSVWTANALFGEKGDFEKVLFLGDTPTSSKMRLKFDGTLRYSTLGCSTLLFSFKVCIEEVSQLNFL